MKAKFLATIASVLTLLISLFSNGFAAAQPAAPHISGGVYKFELKANTHLCLANNGVGKQLSVDTKHCAHVVLSNINGHIRLTDSTTTHHCIHFTGGGSLFKVYLGRHACSNASGVDKWKLTHVNPSRFENDNSSSLVWMGVYSPHAGKKVYVDNPGLVTFYYSWRLVRL